MTKEELLNLSQGGSRIRNDRYIWLSDINEFFESNICIPKGTNHHHHYDDVYHKAVEDKAWKQSDDGEDWYDVVTPLYQYSIKPCKPTYEWQWLEFNNNTGLWSITQYFETTEESVNIGRTKSYRVEQTKRVRQ